MKRYIKFILVAVFMTCCYSVHADDVYPEAILITNTSTGVKSYYLFSSKPYVSVSKDQTLTVGNESGVIFKLALDANSTVNMVLKDSMPDDADGLDVIHCFEPSSNTKNGKYMIDGKIIIYKDGRKYDVNGNRLN